ncbi:MAG: hypothetical protein ACE5EL_01240 [Anaerolineae bacterium]
MRVRRPVVAFGVLVIAVVGVAAWLAGATDLPRPGSPDPATAMAALPTGTVEAVRPSSEADAYPGAYPPAYPMPGAYPTPPPTPALAAHIDGLPEGAVVEGEAITEAWYRGPGVRVDYLKLRLGDGRADWGAVESDSSGSRLVWRLRFLYPDLEPLAMSLRHRWTRDFVVETASGDWLLLPSREVGAAGPMALLSLAGPLIAPDQSDGMVRWLEWDGDPDPEPALVVDEGGGEILYAPAPEALRWLPAVKLLPRDVVVDLDGDGVGEIVSPGDGGGWRVRDWNGSAFVDAASVADAAPSPVVVAPGALPPLPADLFLIRGGVLMRWRAAGGALEDIAGEGTGRDKAQVISFRLSADGTRVAYDLFDPGAAPADQRRLMVVDLESGRTWPVAEDFVGGADLPELGFYAISGDGRQVVFLAEDAPGPGPGAHGPYPGRPPGLAAPMPRRLAGGDAIGTWYLVDLGAPAEARPIGACSLVGEAGTAMGVTAGCAGVLASPDGTRMAWGDGTGLHVMELPAGTTRLLVAAEFGSGGEWGVRLPVPYRWSPDGEAMIVEDRHFEGGGLYFCQLADDCTQRRSVGGTWGRTDVDVGIGGRVAVTSLEDRVLAVVPVDFGPRAGGAAVTGETQPPSDAYSGGVADLLAAKGIDGPGIPISPRWLPGGDLAVTLRYPGERYQGNGVFVVHPDGDWERVLRLPPVQPPGEGEYWDPGRIHWSPDSTAFIVDADREGRWLVGSMTDGALWDVTAALGGSGAITWSGAP